MSVLRLRLDGSRLLAFDGRGAWWEVPAVLFGWRAAKRTIPPANATMLGPLADRTLRRIVGLPGEVAPTAADWRAYGAPLRARTREEAPA